MARYIDADALIQWLKNVWDLESEWTNEVTTITALKQTITDIENQPTADVVEVKHGRWEYLYDGNYKCSECGSWWCCTDSQIDEMNYCPNCGAKMEDSNG